MATQAKERIASINIWIIIVSNNQSSTLALFQFEKIAWAKAISIFIQTKKRILLPSLCARTINVEGNLIVKLVFVIISLEFMRKLLIKVILLISLKTLVPLLSNYLIFKLKIHLLRNQQKQEMQIVMISIQLLGKLNK